ncbi:trypsin-like serine peptidase [Micromonospora sp. NBC_01412]|uniref:trypsin-like serine peptidase n=1 Tax=Micromonospora sp. NBC_01412 TaxID=2903590 RepID=UPI00324934DD
MLRSLRRSLIVITTFTVAVASAAGPASAVDSSSSQLRQAAGTSAQLSPDVARKVKGTDPAARNRALAEYWTPERMRNARPVETVLRKTMEPGTTLPAGAGIDRAQEPVIVPPAAPTVAPPAEVATTNGNAVVTPNAIPPNEPPPVTSPNTYLPDYPTGHQVARTMGKVFFTMGGQEMVCSAGVVSSPGKALVWTAGHCVHGGGSSGTWAHNWIFVPNYTLNSYGNPVAPYGIWYAAALFAARDWIDYKRQYSDLGAVIMQFRGDKLLQNVVGSQGIAFSLPYYPSIAAFGYPAEAPFNGELLWRANSPSGDAGASVSYMLSGMNGGSSGGYWLAEFNGVTGLVNGHNAFTVDGVRGHMFSPYYGMSTREFYDEVKNYTPS